MIEIGCKDNHFSWNNNALSQKKLSLAKIARARDIECQGTAPDILTLPSLNKWTDATANCIFRLVEQKIITFGFCKKEAGQQMTSLLFLFTLSHSSDIVLIQQCDIKTLRDSKILLLLTQVELLEGTVSVLSSSISLLCTLNVDIHYRRYFLTINRCPLRQTLTIRIAILAEVSIVIEE